MLQLRQQDSGVVVRVRALAGARRNGVTGTHDGRLKIAVTQVAEKGKANAEITRILATAAGVKRGDVELISGATAPLKEFLVKSVPLGELEARLIIAANQS